MTGAPREACARRLRAEIEDLTTFYAVDPASVSRLVEDLGAYLDERAQVTLTARGFELTVTCRGAEAAASLAAAAGRQGAALAAVAAFLACGKAFPGRAVGMEVGFGPGLGGPSLLHGTLAPKEDVLLFLSTQKPIVRAIPSLSRALEPCRTVHGLAFTAVRGELTIEVSACEDARDYADGVRRRELILHHVAKSRASSEVKRTLTEMPWDAMQLLGEPWPRIIDFARRRLGCGWTDTGILESDGRTSETKLHVARAGPVATSCAAR